MATTRSPKVTRDYYVSAMGEDLGEAFYELWSEVALLFRDWGEFTELFGTKPERVELMNKAAPVFFRAVQVALFEVTVLRIARLTDPPKSTGKSNLTIQRLPSLVDPSVTDKLVVLMETAKTASSFCRDWRNRQIAHRDLDLALSKSAEPLPEATLKKVRGAITALGNILNALHQHYMNSTTLFDFDSHPGGAASLIRVVEDGMRVKSDRLKMLRRGVIPPPREVKLG